MKREKLTLKGVKTVLNREELREIMAGGCSSGGGGNCAGYNSGCGNSGPIPVVACCSGLCLDGICN